MGHSGESAGDTLVLAPSAALLASSFGNEAPKRISRIEAELALHGADPDLDASEIYFGLLFQSANGDGSAGIQVQQVGPDVISLALYKNGAADVISQRSVTNLITRLRLDRDPSTGAVSAYFNDSLIGDSIDTLPPDAALEPAIFVKDGGVVIGVSAWQITLE